VCGSLSGLELCLALVGKECLGYSGKEFEKKEFLFVLSKFDTAELVKLGVGGSLV